MNDDEPVPVTAALDGLLRSMRGGAGRAEVGGVFGRWDDAVGPMIAAHVRPVRLEHGVLLVEVERAGVVDAGPVPGRRHPPAPARGVRRRGDVAGGARATAPAAAAEPVRAPSR